MRISDKISGGTKEGRDVRQTEDGRQEVELGRRLPARGVRTSTSTTLVLACWSPRDVI
ncbi:hypothetical protein K443DRAFT_161404 [Laccaria amethystina LaAM-08-1]|uniref:Unplaced genomic scaffold K443scaffold_1063, whole genome shotgun sequence n=1 Tax=Laccaria amethystina LaAM-08-1 TaxID=1095629 RepID=A0A0C9WGK0_9AGAR|nr:hypothetical protein K443DRAFT_161404 [Laccaria amethystina LaAM-08-1]